MIFEQTNPYSAEETDALNLANFGGKPPPDQYQHAFPYPATIAIVLFPLGLLPYSAAYSVWISLQFPMLFAALYLLMRFLKLDLHWTRVHLLFFAGSIGFLYPIVSYALGQVSIFILLLFSLSYYFSQRKMTFLAGASLAFIAIRPDVFILACITLLVILWGSRQEIMRAGIATIVVLLGLNVVTLPMIGFWYIDWINIILEYSANNPYAHYPLDALPNSATRVSMLIVLITYLSWQLIRFLKGPSESKKLLLVSSLFIIYSLTNKLTGTYHMTLLLIPALILLRQYTKSKLQWLVWLTIFLPWLDWITPFSANSIPWISSIVVPLSFLILQIIYLRIGNSHPVTISVIEA